MICPECGAETAAAMMCPGCGSALADGDEMADLGGWVRLVQLSSEAEAQLIQGYLENAGIPCQVESLVFHAEPVNLGHLSRVRLHVLRGHRAAALELLQQAQRDAAEALTHEPGVDDPDDDSAPR